MHSKRLIDIGTAYKMDETLTACFEALKNNGIHIEHFRSDSAACQESIIEVAANNCTHFYIRIDNTQYFREAIKDIPETDWKEIIINNKKAGVADSPFQTAGAKNMYRAVVQRRKRKDGQYDIFTQAPYTYYAIITNNENPQATPQWVTEFYNQRGDSDPPLADDILNPASGGTTAFRFPSWMQTWYICPLLPSVSLYLNG